MEPLIQAITLHTFDTMVTVESLVRSYTPKISPCKSISTALSPHSDALQRQYMIERVANALSHALDIVVFEHLVNHTNAHHVYVDIPWNLENSHIIDDVSAHLPIPHSTIIYPLKLYGYIHKPIYDTLNHEVDTNHLYDDDLSIRCIGSQYLNSSNLSMISLNKSILLKYNISNNNGIITLNYSIKDIMDPKITIIHGVC